eukprot:756415-Hanusia_phi.AAC.3
MKRCSIRTDSKTLITPQGGHIALQSAFERSIVEITTYQLAVGIAGILPNLQRCQTRTTIYTVPLVPGFCLPSSALKCVRMSWDLAQDQFHRLSGSGSNMHLT